MLDIFTSLMILNKKIRLLLLICFATAKAQTPKKTDHQSIVWTRYYNQLLLSEKWSLHSEIDNRVFTKPIQQNVYVLRVQGRYRINSHLETGAGLAHFSVTTQKPEINPDFRIPEYRGQQDLTWRISRNKLNINQRFQVEERFIHNANAAGLLPGSTFSWRFRYRLQGDYTFWKKENQAIKAILSDEIMFNAGKSNSKNTFDQNRIYAAIHFQANNHLSYELGYLNSYQRRASGVDFFDRDIIRLSVFHRLNWKNKS